VNVFSFRKEGAQVRGRASCQRAGEKAVHSYLPSRAEVDALLAIDGTLQHALAPSEAHIAEVASRTGLSIREIRGLANVEASGTETRRGAYWLTGGSLRF
jgi:hypothetical protein